MPLIERMQFDILLRHMGAVRKWEGFREALPSRKPSHFFRCEPSTRSRPERRPAYKDVRHRRTPASRIARTTAEQRGWQSVAGQPRCGCLRRASAMSSSLTSVNP
jgi:hypothetical protein